jgi:hypothetical protein
MGRAESSFFISFDLLFSLILHQGNSPLFIGRKGLMISTMCFTPPCEIPCRFLRISSFAILSYATRFSVCLIRLTHVTCYILLQLASFEGVRREAEQGYLWA